MTLAAPSSAALDDEVTRIDVTEPGQELALAGRLDFRSAYTIRRALDDAIVAGVGDLVVDVRLAEIHDSAGLGLLVGAHRRAEVAGRRLVLLHPSDRLERLVRAARLGRVLHRIG